MNTKLISLCMIVGNVAEYIERCLRSFAGVADEVVLIRAIGSAEPDDTFKIAARVCEEMGFTSRASMCDPEYKSYFLGEYRNAPGHEEWKHVDDFGAARQLSFAMARGKYCLWVDSDDVLKCGGEVIRELAESGGAPLWIFPYEVFGRGVTVPRERLVLREAPGQWMYPVHECYRLEEALMGEMRTDERVVVQHLPFREKTGSVDRNLRILESIPRETMSAGLLFHLHTELRYAGRKEEAIEVAKLALGHAEIGRPEKYELLCELGRMCGRNVETGMQYFHLAYAADPCRREALGTLACLSIDLGRADDALAYARQMLATSAPRVWSWNDRQAAYGWLGAEIYQQALRVNGLLDEAEAVRVEGLRLAGGAKISLLHATRGRARKASECRKLWMDLAEDPSAIEHIFAIDDDDEESKVLRRFHHVSVPAGGGCVRAWNAAAALAMGKVLVQLSDDWLPPAKWDRLILERMGDVRAPLVLRVSDGHRRDGLLCMAICTREYWALDWFLFHPDFTGVYSDNYFTAVAEARGAIVDASHLVFEHKHPAFDATVEVDATYAAQNAQERYDEGAEIFKRLTSGPDWSKLPGWTRFWPFYQWLAREFLKDDDVFVEVGVWKGRSFALMAQECNRMKKRVRFVAVDHFLDEHGRNFREEFERNVKPWFANPGPGIIEQASWCGAEFFGDGECAVVFIDAAHDYESVRRDIEAWLPKVRKGGIIAGDDADSADVARAVRELVPGASVSGSTWCWVVGSEIADCRLPIADCGASGEGGAL